MIKSILCALAMVVVPPDPPPARVTEDITAAQPSRAKATLVSLFSADDYPENAMRKKEQGTVAVRLDVARDGTVSSCSVTQTSGSATLDLATCSILKERARFVPARDSSGRPIEDAYSQRIRWMLPERRPEPVVDSSRRQIYTIDADRKISQCLRQTGESPSKIHLCGPEREYFQAMIDKAPKSFGVSGRELVLEIAQYLGDAGAVSRLGERPGEKVMGRDQIRLTIDDQGTVVDCKLEESVGDRNEGRGEAMCAPERNRKFEALDPGVTNRGVRFLMKIGALYFRAK